VQIVRVDNGVFTRLCNNLLSNTWNGVVNLDIKYPGPQQQMSFFIDNQLVCTATDATYPSGAVMLWSTSEAPDNEGQLQVSSVTINAGVPPPAATRPEAAGIPFENPRIGVR
jgi:hypothetical protein